MPQSRQTTESQRRNSLDGVAVLFLAAVVRELRRAVLVLVLPNCYNSEIKTSAGEEAS